MNELHFRTYDDTGEVSYIHPNTGRVTFLEDDQTIESVIDGWNGHWADMADDAWSERDD